MENDGRTQGASLMVNDRIYDTLWGVGATDGAFVCECERSSCAEKVAMTIAEYVRLRNRGEIVTAAGHDGAIL